MFLAHVKWFTQNLTTYNQPISGTEYVVIVLFVFLGLFVLLQIDKYMEKIQPIAKLSDDLQPLKQWLPTVVRLSLATMLLYGSINRYFLVPNLPTSTTLENLVLIFASIMGVLLILGAGTRLASLGLIILCIVSVPLFGFIPMLEHIEIIGLSAFLMLEGAGKYAFDNALDLNWKAPLKYRRYSLDLLIISAGISLVVLAFTEKIFDIDLAMAFLQEHNWNFLSSLGVSDRGFILFIGASELLIGLSLVLRLASRLIVLMLLILLTITAILLGIEEVVGHIFAVSVVLAAWLAIDLPLMKSKIK